MYSKVLTKENSEEIVTDNLLSRLWTSFKYVKTTGSNVSDEEKEEA